jgi:hypothetical protein
MRVPRCTLLALAGCSFDGAAGGDAGGPPDGGRPDAMPGEVLWRTETEPEFAAGATIAGVAIARGGIEPIAYTYGALWMRGSDAREYTDPAPANLWDTLEAIPAAGRSGAGLAVPPVYDQRDPGGVGLTASTDWTIWADGEIFLEAGVHAFQLTADDQGVLEIGDGTGAFTRVITAPASNATASGSFDAPATGWYPVRLALAQGSGGATFFLTDDPPGGGAATRAPVERWRYRTAANALAGLYQSAFDHPFLVRPTGTDLFEAPAIDEDWGITTPADLGLGNQVQFALRWTGQVYIDAPEPHTFTADTEDGHRLWIDGQLVIDDWMDNAPAMGSSPPLALAPGWHDLVFDLNDGGASSRAALTMAVGAAAPAPIPAAALRPATGRGERIAFATRVINPNFENGALDHDLDFYVVGAPGEFATALEVSFTATHADWTQLRVTAIPPAGTPLTLHDQGIGTGQQQVIVRVPAPAPIWPVDGRWRFQFTDVANPDSGSADVATLTIHHAGGAPTVATTATWVSGVHDFGRDVVIDRVTFAELVPAGATRLLEVKSCSDPTCSDGAWTEVPTSGDDPATPAGRYAQLRVELTSDGDASPHVAWIDVTAR